MNGLSNQHCTETFGQWFTENLKTVYVNLSDNIYKNEYDQGS